ncbi:MAG TPA: hypothetical protein VN915_10055 [Elusimicrobiota bacterium]|nr:hypothetical protein [Elusimicrobiota bacterium]
MHATDTPYLHGALTLLEESRSAVEALFDQFETATDRKSRRAIVEAALHELKVHATIEELMLHPALDKAWVASEKAPRRHVARLIAELQAMTGEEKRHDAKFALLSANVRRRLRGEGPGPLPLSLLAFEGGTGPKQQKGPSAGSYG